MKVSYFKNIKFLLQISASNDILILIDINKTQVTSTSDVRTNQFSLIQCVTLFSCLLLSPYQIIC